MTNLLLDCRNLTHGYVRGGERLTVIKDLNFQIHRGDFIALMGPSGSGKSTLLNLIGGLDQPNAGTITVDGVDLTSLSSKTLTEWRASTVGFIFQFYNLIPVLTAAQNVELPLLLTDISSRERGSRVSAALEIVDLTERAQHKPGELSGGQQQRVAIARAIVADPTLLVCDEPTGDLDRATADDVLNLLRSLNRDFGKTICMVTHDPKAADYAGRTLHMDKGQVAA